MTQRFLSIILLGLFMLSCSPPPSHHVVLLHVEDDPTITFRIWFQVGSQCDPAGKEGLASLTAAMIAEGATETRAYEDILTELYPLASSYGASVDKEMTVLSGRVHQDNLDMFYNLFLDAILHPAFSEEDFVRIRTEMLNRLEKSLRYANDEELGKAVFSHFVYEGTQYAHIAEGTISSLENITVEDVRRFYRAWYTRNNVVIGLGGGYNAALLRRLEEDLALLPESRPTQPEAPEPAAFNGLHFRIVEKDCNATAISFGYPIDVLRGDDDFWALAVFNSWFGEHRNSSSHLYQVIRETRGMNYGDYSYIEHFANGGSRQMPAPHYGRRQQLFEVWLRPVQHVHRHFALRAAIRELQSVVENGMTQAQFDLTQRFLTTYALHYATSTSSRLGYAIDSRFYGIDQDYVDLFRRKIDALTLEDVNDAIRRHIQFHDLKIAVVTSGAEQFVEELVADQPSPVEYDTPKPQEVLDEDLQIMVYPLNVQRANISVISVDQVFE
ncbi:MAG: insulinase family protein [Bacteroidetes bacterium]|nr:insulinase family protein [Bacteroidota bacterium]